MEHYALKLNLFFDSEREAKIVFKALQPELNSKHETRSKTELKLKKCKLSINIKAVDAIALRASFNSFLKAVMLSKNLLEVI